MFLSDDDMVECPYNKTHRMLRKRLQSHLLKCRLNYPDVELRKCPFNITHLIPEPEFTHHATNCPDRKLITQYKYDAPEQKKEEEGPKHAPIECDENWDDTDVNDYNPRLYLDKAKIIRQPDGANRSERKLFIKKERKRLGDGDDSSDEESKPGVATLGNKRQRQDSFDSVDDEVLAKNHSPKSYNEERMARNSRSKRSTSPSSSSYSKCRSRSPINKSARNSSRSPTRRGTPDYSSFNQDVYYNGNGRNVSNNQFNSGRDPYYSSQTYYDRNIETGPIIPQAPPPPMISYPVPRSYFSNKPQPPASGH